MRTYTEGEIVKILRERLERARTQKALSVELGFSPQFVNDVLANRRKLTKELASALGFREHPRQFTAKVPE